jgi:uncharacterized protein YhbP (UPF0306 family)
MTDVQVPSEVLVFLQEHQTLMLATSSKNGLPWANTFLYVNDGTTLSFWARPTSLSAENIAEQPTVAFAIDEYSADLREARGLHGRGECRAITGEEIARVAARFGQKFPQLSRGQTMSIMFFSITPSELVFIDNHGSTRTSIDDEFGATFHTRKL